MNITIFHKDADVWECTPIKGAEVFLVKRAKTERGGAIAYADATVRIPTVKALQIDAGDKVFIGTSDAASPPSGCLTVTAVKDNRRGSLAHWRLDCQ